MRSGLVLLHFRQGPTEYMIDLIAVNSDTIIHGKKCSQNNLTLVRLVKLQHKTDLFRTEDAFSFPFAR